MHGDGSGDERARRRAVGERVRNDAPRRRERFHQAPGGGDLRTWAEGGLIAVVLSLLGRRGERERIRQAARDARQRGAENEAGDRPRRWSHAERHARDGRLRRRGVWFFLLCFVVAGAYMALRFWLEYGRY